MAIGSLRCQGPRLHKFRYDLLYILRRTLWLDLWLIVVSLWISVPGHWEHRRGSSEMTSGPPPPERGRVERPVPAVSVVIPVFNEEPNLEPLYERLEPVLERLGQPYEVRFVDDSNGDEEQRTTRVVYLHGKRGGRHGA